jgi:hypothetical protein
MIRRWGRRRLHVSSRRDALGNVERRSRPSIGECDPFVARARHAADPIALRPRGSQIVPRVPDTDDESRRSTDYPLGLGETEEEADVSHSEDADKHPVDSEY